MKFSIKLDKSQKREFGKYLFDLSKLVLISLVLKLFEPGAPKFTIGSILIIVLGLTTSVLIAIIALYFLRE